MKSNITVYHERLELPLYHLPYHIIVGELIPEMLSHARALFPGMQLELPLDVLGYTYIVKHPTMGEQIVIMISTADGPGFPSLLSTIVHECTNLSWYILDSLGIDVDAESHATQSYIMEELVIKVTDIIEKFKDSPNPPEENSTDSLDSL